MNTVTFSVVLDGKEIREPLDLLLVTLKKDPKNFLLIQISDIIDQYLAALALMSERELENYADFIAMAAELMLIKSKLMLPHADEGEDPRQEMYAMLMTHQQKLEAIAFLRAQFDMHGQRMAKDPEETEIDLDAITHQDLKLLTRAFQRLLRRNQEHKMLADVPVQKINTLLRHRVVPVEERVFSILRYLYVYGETEFEDLLFLSETRSELIASFAAILELVKVQRLHLRYEGNEEDLTAPVKIYFTLDLEHRRRKPGERSEEEPAISIT